MASSDEISAHRELGFLTPPPKKSSPSHLYQLSPELFLSREKELRDDRIQSSTDNDPSRGDIMKVRELKMWLTEFEESNRQHFQRSRQSLPAYRPATRGGLLTYDDDEFRPKMISASNSMSSKGSSKMQVDSQLGIISASSTESAMSFSSSDCDKSCESQESAPRVTCKKITPDDLPFLRPKPSGAAKGSRLSLGPDTLVGKNVQKYGGRSRSGRRSIIASRKDELEKRWAESKRVEHVTKVKWGVVDGVYKRTVVVEAHRK